MSEMLEISPQHLARKVAPLAQQLQKALLQQPPCALAFSEAHKALCTLLTVGKEQRQLQVSGAQWQVLEVLLPLAASPFKASNDHVASGAVLQSAACCISLLVSDGSSMHQARSVCEGRVCQHASA